MRKAADRELGRLERLPTAAAEYGVIRSYLEWIISLPWDEETEDNLDLDNARQRARPDHFDLDKVKERIVEHLAVAKLRNEISGQILCFVGPPGVGKTSLGHSIANALGRKFVRMSVGGVRDEAEIRGHRRTYIGALPGTIIRSLRDAESRNPVILIDEIDKMGSDYRGDPASAMLEVLDPEQNRTFRDHYLDLPFDLSKVLFICTANTLDTIPGPLLDRMDTIELVGLHRGGEARDREAVPAAEAARRRGPEALAAVDLGHGAADDHPRVHARGRRAEPRAAARGRLPEGGDAGRARARRRRRGSTTSGCASGSGRGGSPARCGSGPRRPGVATGLAYTPAGGDVLFIEAAAYPGKGELTVTGQLGDVMKESAKAALSWVRSHTAELGVPEQWFEEHDIHIHVPGGRGAEGRAVGRSDDRDRDRVARSRRAGRRRRRDDRRDHAHRTGAADRRDPREVARRAAGRASSA